MHPAGWHRARHRELLRRAPDIRQLQGNNHWTALFIVAIVLLQLSAAVAARHWPWYLLLLCAYFVGATLTHALGVLIHECAHDLVFRSKSYNRVFAIIANIPLMIPGAIDFREKHLLHHKHLGEGAHRDFQTPTPEAIQFVGRSRLRKFFWLSLGSVVFPKRPIEGLKSRNDRWLPANVVVQVVAMVAFTLAFGPWALAFLAASSLFAFGPHPLGMRGYGRHLPLRDGQPTASYYGLGNFVSFNVGYHVEHHDFPAIPWNRLPEVRRHGGPEYDDLAHHRSWTRLLVEFLSGDRFGVDSYVSATPDRPKDTAPPTNAAPCPPRA
ncbi:MAG: fatty acid desaturase [Polyangiaceae bacterium]|nr:fatty acid desaturase [Polyangiaceae bacterium]